MIKGKSYSGPKVPKPEEKMPVPGGSNEPSYPQDMSKPKKSKSTDDLRKVLKKMKGAKNG
jgi:hypothetical protein